MWWSRSNPQASSSCEMVPPPVGEGVQDNCHPYEVWGINSSGAVFRYNYCTKQFLPIANALLAEIATGGGDVWGLDIGGGVYHFDFATQTFVNPVFTHLSQITVGVNDMWGLGLAVDGSFIARYDPSTASFGNVKGSL